jgi:ribosomal protein S18 acetylase RimI-like enzyme
MDTNDIIIERAKDFSSDLVDAVNSLIKQEGNNYRILKDEDLKEMLGNPQSFLFTARYIPTGMVVGIVMVMIYRIPYTKKAYFDDLIVDEKFRKRGIATRLLQKVIDAVRENNAAYLDFTARLRRSDSNSLYEKLGFKKRDTHVYRLVFDYAEV